MRIGLDCPKVKEKVGAVISGVRPTSVHLHLSISVVTGWKLMLTITILMSISITLFVVLIKTHAIQGVETF